MKNVIDINSKIESNAGRFSRPNHLVIADTQIQQLVAIHGSKVMTTSLLVAEMFDKRHDNVVRDIRKLMEDLPPEDLLNFEEISAEDSYGRKQPAFEMNRDGFSLLAMGFAGKKALEWKLKFLKAFNFMEEALLSQARPMITVDALKYENMKLRLELLEMKLGKLVARDNKTDAEALVRQVERFFERYGESRFVSMGPEGIHDPARPVLDRAGFRKTVVSVPSHNIYTEYFVLPFTFRKMVTGFDFRWAVRMLIERGMLRPGRDKSSVSVNLPGMKKSRCYHFPARDTGERNHH